MSDIPTLRCLLGDSKLPANEARILLAYVLEKHYQLPRSALLSRDEMILSAIALDEWGQLESRRMSGEPVAYILGKKGFHSIELMVAPGVLIPRPETELLVDLALMEVAKINGGSRVLDLGTGSGAIALAIARGAPSASVLATDQCKAALVIAQKNADTLKLADRVKFAHGSWYAALKEQSRFDVIVSNPPYIPRQDPHLLLGDLRFEPTSALTDGSNGLFCLETIIFGAKKFLKPGGFISVEHGFDQSEAVRGLMEAAGLKGIQVHHDLAGHDRVCSARTPV